MIGFVRTTAACLVSVTVGEALSVALAETGDLVSRVVDAFSIDDEAQIAALQSIYRRWLEARAADLGTLPANIKTSVVEGLVNDKVDEITRAEPQERLRIAALDKIDAELSPIEQRARRWAQDVKAGQLVAPDVISDARKALIVVEGLVTQRNRLERVKEDGLLTRLSETVLDLAYTIKGGDGPQSLRLGHTPP